VDVDTVIPSSGSFWAAVEKIPKIHGWFNPLATHPETSHPPRVTLTGNQMLHRLYLDRPLEKKGAGPI
jgi:hypothetical protein